MKKIIYILFSLFILSAPLFSQSEIDALRFSREDIHGTARAMSMGGAFGALGGDLTGISINPAGISVYRSSEVVGTVNLTGEKSIVGDTKKNKTRFDMDNLGFVGYFPLRNDVMPLINFGFSYNKVKSFNKKVSAFGDSESTLVDYIYDDYRHAGIRNDDDLVWIENEYDPFQSQPWLPALGRNTSILHPNQAGTALIPINTGGERPIGQIGTEESGYIGKYDFTAGTTINNVLSLGLALTIHDISYDQHSYYAEDYSNESWYELNNRVSASGAGISGKLGLIYRPVNALRIGFAWHTPSWIAITETYSAELLEDIQNFIPSYVTDYKKGGFHTAQFLNNYDLTTPGKIVASVATVLGKNFIASVDYEVTDYSKMKFNVPSNDNNRNSSWYDIDNEFIKNDHKLTSSVRIGTEYRFTPQFSARLGYAWMQNPYNADFVALGNAVVAGSNTVFRMEGDANYFTGGLGYRFNKNFYLDMAVVYKTQNDDLYPFPNIYEGDQLIIDAAPFSLKNNSLRGLLTLGYKF